MKRVVLFALCLWPLLGSANALRPLVFGSVAMDIPAVMHKRLTPLTEYLSEQLGRPVVLALSPNMASAIDRLAAGEVDLAYLTPVAYLEANRKGDAQVLVKTLTEGRGSFQLMLVARQDSGIRVPADLRGRSFAFGDPKALLHKAVVRAAALSPSDFAEIAYLGHYDNIARGIQVGDFDGGILKDTTAMAWQSKGLHVIYRSEPLPPYNIAVRRGMPGDDAEALREAFLNLDPAVPEHAPIIRALSPKYTGFAPTSDAEYDVVRTLVAPFRQDAAQASAR